MSFVHRVMWDCVPVSSDEENMEFDSEEPIVSTAPVPSISSPLPSTPVDSSTAVSEGLKTQEQQEEVQPAAGAGSNSADGGTEENVPAKW